VKGFAFTLGLSTILDLLVVFLFTHPMLSVLSRSRAFGSPRFTGLNSLRPTTGTVPDEDQPRTRPARIRRAASSAPDRAGSTAVAVAEPDTEADSPPEPTTPDGPPPDTAPDEPRRRTTPAPGTAAERAAARRARMRQQGDEGGSR